MVLFVTIYLIPFIWLLLTSFKTRPDALSSVPKLIFSPTLDNYIKAFGERGFLKYMINSFIIATVTSALVVLLAFPCAYSFSRIKLRGDNHLFFIILTTRMGPGVLVSVPIFLMFSRTGLWDTHIGVILVHTAFNLALAIWILKGFIDGIPRELDEAAWLCGMKPTEVLFKIILPMCSGGIVITVIFTFVMSWIEFLYALLLTGDFAKTLPVALAGLVTPHGTLWGQIAAVATLTSVPVLVTAYILEKYVARGLTFGVVR